MVLRKASDYKLVGRLLLPGNKKRVIANMPDLYNTSKWQHIREGVLRRANYYCKNCLRYGIPHQASTVHHILPREYFPELETTGWNLIALCDKCHNKMHDRDSHELTDLGMQWAERIARNHRKETEGWRMRFNTRADGQSSRDGST